jgi:hypothetical protein
MRVKTFNNYNDTNGLYVCEIWFLTLRREYGCKMGENTGKCLETNRKSKLYCFTGTASVVSCGLVVRFPGYRSRGPGSISGTARKQKVVGLERGSLSLVSTTEELLDRKVGAPV